MKKMIIIIVSTLIAGTTVFAQEKAGTKDTTQHANFYSCSLHSGIEMYKTGTCPTCGMKLDVSKKEAMKREVTKSYACPVHANVTSDKTVKCPKATHRRICPLKKG
jgi:hypothetical protein